MNYEPEGHFGTQNLLWRFSPEQIKSRLYQGDIGGIWEMKCKEATPEAGRSF